VILLIDVILIIVVDFDGSLLWKWCEIIWWILFVELSLLKKCMRLKTNDGHLSLPLSINMIFHLLLDLILRHFVILLVHLD
jgi:hypothetical protein